MINALLPIIGTVLDKVIPDNNAKQKAKQEIEKALIDNAAKINLTQAETNKIEASHRSVFVSGWRPFLGWCSGLGFAGFRFFCKRILTKPSFGIYSVVTIYIR